MKTSIQGTYFYKQDEFKEGERASMDFCAQKLDMTLDEAVEKELCVKGDWGIEELAILLNKPVSTIANDGTVKNVLMKTGSDWAKNRYKTIPSTELVEEKKSVLNRYKKTLRDKIVFNMLSPKRLREELEVEKDKADSEIQSRSILNKINAVDAELTAYNEVLLMLA